MELAPLTATGQPLNLHNVGVSDALIVHIDFKSPYAFLAIEPTRRMLKKLGLVADWRPFVLDIGSYLGTAKLAKDGKVATQSRSKEQWSGVKYAYFDCRRYANLADLTIRGTVKIWNTNLPAIGMWWIKLHEDLNAQNQADGLLQRYLDAIYLPFWRREFDAEDLDAVFKTLVQIGAPTAGFKAFAEGAGKTYNDAVQQQTFDWESMACRPTCCPSFLMWRVTPVNFLGVSICLVSLGCLPVSKEMRQMSPTNLHQT